MPVFVGFCPKYLNVLQLYNHDTETVYDGIAAYPVSSGQGKLPFKASGIDQPDSIRRHSLSTLTHLDPAHPAHPALIPPGYTSDTHRHHIPFSPTAPRHPRRPTDSRLIVTIGDNHIFSAYHIQAYYSSHNDSTGRNEKEICAYDLCQLWDIELKATVLPTHALSSPLASYLPPSAPGSSALRGGLPSVGSTMFPTLSRPIRQILAVPMSRYSSIWDSLLFAASTTSTHRVADKFCEATAPAVVHDDYEKDLRKVRDEQGVGAYDVQDVGSIEAEVASHINICMFILDQSGVVWCVDPSLNRSVIIGVGPFASIEYIPYNDLLHAPSPTVSSHLHAQGVSHGNSGPYISIPLLTLGQSKEGVVEGPERERRHLVEEDGINAWYVAYSTRVSSLLGAVLLSASTASVDTDTHCSRLIMPSPLLKLSTNISSSPGTGNKTEPTSSANRIKCDLCLAMNIFPLKSLTSDESSFGVSAGAIELAIRRRFHIVSGVDLNLTVAKSSKLRDRMTNVISTLMKSPIGNVSIASFSIHYQLFHIHLQVLVNYILSNTYNTRNMNTHKGHNSDLSSMIHAKEVIYNVLLSLSAHPPSIDLFMKQIEYYCKDLIYDICQTYSTTHGPNYTKSGIAFRLALSFFYHEKSGHNSDLFYRLIGSLGRKLEPEIITRLFPLYIHINMNDILSRDMNKLLIYTPLGLYELCLCQNEYSHASRLLTLACDHLGGSETTLTLCNSILLSLELLQQALLSGYISMAIECFEFCDRLEQMLYCCIEDLGEIYDCLIWVKKGEKRGCIVNYGYKTG